MKDWIASKLRKIAQKLSPISHYEEVENYKACEVANAISFTKKDMRNTRANYNLSCRAATSKLIKECMTANRKAILNRLTANKIFVERVYAKGGSTIVETRLKILAREKDIKEQAKSDK